MSSRTLRGYPPRSATKLDAFVVSALVGAALGLGVLVVCWRGALHVSGTGRRVMLATSAAALPALLIAITFSATAYASCGSA